MILDQDASSRRRRSLPRSISVSSWVTAGASAGSAVLVGMDAQVSSTSTLPSFIALSLTMLAVSAATAAWGAWSIQRRSTSAIVQIFGCSAVVVVALAITAATLSAWAQSDPEGKFARELGGPGRCLDGTPYDSSRASLLLEANGRMIISVPGAGKDSQLTFLQRSKGELTPGNDQTRAILGSYDC